MDDNYAVAERSGSDYDIIECGSLDNGGSGLSVKQGAAMAGGGVLLGAAIMLGVKKLFWDKNTKKQIDETEARFNKEIEDLKAEQERQLDEFRKLLKEAGLEVIIEKAEGK